MACKVPVSRGDACQLGCSGCGDAERAHTGPFHGMSMMTLLTLQHGGGGFQTRCQCWR